MKSGRNGVVGKGLIIPMSLSAQFCNSVCILCRDGYIINFYIITVGDIPVPSPSIRSGSFGYSYIILKLYVLYTRFPNFSWHVVNKTCLMRSGTQSRLFGLVETFEGDVVYFYHAYKTLH